MKTKKILLFTLAVMCFSLMATAQRGVRIGYIDMEYILENVPEYREASTQLEGKVQRWKQDIEKKQKEVDQMKLNLANERVLLTVELIEEREEEIKIKEDEILQYQQDRFGPNGDLMIQRRQLVQPIQDQVFNIIQEVAENKKYDFIFDKSADVVMLFAAKRNDISDVVLRSIERAGRRVQAETKREQQQIEESPDPLDGPITAEEKERAEEKEERAEAIEEKKNEREQMMLERQRQRDSIRDAKKAEFEARRQRLLEERERRRDSIIQAREDKRNGN
ncbi:OmpH family outer membrane protein [Aequorivita echinoideorum]|uniref:OmpH family outer membrane protein n=1 Tax=Aequorivita echinoideorum TaxID=1549647 RepID=A0ABS5S398_9FLAO|nr:OmpH family outer membrane protein [Aequorivita echinoideorum]MBT0607685.1 OmpH family outer membrane protein [Aequorivita echinoideorum]